MDAQEAIRRADEVIARFPRLDYDMPHDEWRAIVAAAVMDGAGKVADYAEIEARIADEREAHAAKLKAEQEARGAASEAAFDAGIASGAIKLGLPEGD